MKIAQLSVSNFRGISKAKVAFDSHAVLIGDNNAGKSTIFEAIDLVLGPDRLNRTPVIDEHDFFSGIYYVEEGLNPAIEIEIVILDLTEEQKIKFRNHLEFWDSMIEIIVTPGSIDTIDEESIKPCLRVKFIGQYNTEDDDFNGDTFFCWPENEDNSLTKFTKRDKRECGFLYLRAIRTGSRALSMERGSLLDIILRIKEIRPKIWENVLSQLRETTVAENPEVGIKDILEGIQASLKNFVPADWGAEPKLRVSDLTREHLRKTLTVFMSTGPASYHAPFHHQGTGTINTMVLALLSMIAELKKNVIFAMEEPEIAIPPYTQKRIVDSIKKNSSQAIFTSHSPFVIEEFSSYQIILIQRQNDGIMNSQYIHFPDNIKRKNYSNEFRQRFAESLLAKRILLTEGTTEATSFSAAARRLSELGIDKFSSLEAMGVAIFNAGSDSSISNYGKYFKSIGKTVFAVFDKQESDQLEKIQSSVDHFFESNYEGFETLVLEESIPKNLDAYYWELIDDGNWPQSLSNFKYKKDDDISQDQIKKALFNFFKKNKGDFAVSDLLASCNSIDEMPASIRLVLEQMRDILDPLNILEK